jgi:hypothetical protein
VNRRLSRIRSSAVLVLTAAAVAAPAAVADTPVADHPGVGAPDNGRLVVGDSVRDRFSPATGRQVVGDPVGDRSRPGAPPIVVSAPPLAEANQFDWLDAGIGAGGLALLLLAGTGAARTVRIRRGLVRAS